jgi:single-stranded-DNA-specific exonuclease
VWEDVPADGRRVTEASAALGVPVVIAQLLAQRGLSDPAEAERFLRPSLAHLHDPFRLEGMAAAVDRVIGAIDRGERIAVHGDYDVDGVTATAIVQRAIEMLGGHVEHFVPNRLRDGYGLQPATIERLASAGSQLVISVDCGIRAGDAAERARDLGVDLIITDHHEPEATLPRALAVLNPKRADGAYPDKHLSGAGVALKLVQGLLSRAGRSADVLPHFVKIAALGTLADVVPLVGENRVIARCGLDALSRGPHAPGLEALLQETGLSGRALDSYHVGFMLGPRINAAGRMQSADLAVDLLLLRGKDEAVWTRARALARALEEENAKRQAEEAAILADARRQVEGDPAIGAHSLLVAAGEGWHRGVVGIVASKLTELFAKPALVLSLEGGLAYGSGRSIPGFDLLDALERCADLFLKFGGHRQAAGLTMETARIAELRQRLTAWADAALAPDDLVPRLRIDAPLDLRDISSEVVQGIVDLAPFGVGNPKPVFRAASVEIVQPPRRLKDRHLALVVRQDGRSFRAMAWRQADREAYLAANRRGLELAYSLEQNEFRGERTTELSVADLRVAEAS